MDLNFQLRKPSPSLPVRICAYSIGPPSSNLMSTPKITHSGIKISPPAMARLKSRARFRNGCLSTTLEYVRIGTRLAGKLAITIENGIDHCFCIKQCTHPFLCGRAKTLPYSRIAEKEVN